MRTLDPQQRLYKFLEWGNKFSKERGYVRIWGALGRPVIIACHPSSMKRILKTAGTLKNISNIKFKVHHNLS
jgi:hypothetical protein